MAPTTQRRSFRYWPWIMALVLAPSLFWGLAAYLSMDRYEARKSAIEVTATVEEIETQNRVTKEDLRGHPLEYQDRQQVSINFTIENAIKRGLLLNASFEPGSSWLQYADFDRLKHPAGSQISILVRRDLDFAATSASIMAGYLLPIYIAGFGCVVFLLIGFAALALSLGKRNHPSFKPAA